MHYMKTILSVAVALVLFLCLQAQVPGTILNKPTKAIVKNWRDYIYLKSPDYWDDGIKGPDIIQQIGEKEYEKVKKFSDRNNVPCQFQIFCEDRDGAPKKNIDSLMKKLGKLTVFKIATYTHNSKSGKSFPMVIVGAPYEDNKNWDPTVKWDTIYFLVPAQSVEEVK